MNHSQCLKMNYQVVVKSFYLSSPICKLICQSSYSYSNIMCSYKNRVLAVTKNIVLLQDGQLQKLLQALHPKYAVTNSSCYKLFCYCLQLQIESLIVTK